MSPANRGTLVTSLCLIFVFMGSFAGYYSARIYKLFHGKEWKKNTLLAALFYPTVMGIIFLGINFFVWYVPLALLVTKPLPYITCQRHTSSATCHLLLSLGKHRSPFSLHSSRYYGSSTATPFGTMISLLMLWLGVSTPLVFIGSYFGFRKEIIEVNDYFTHIPI